MGLGNARLCNYNTLALPVARLTGLKAAFCGSITILAKTPLANTALPGICGVCQAGTAYQFLHK